MREEAAFNLNLSKRRVSLPTRRGIVSAFARESPRGPRFLLFCGSKRLPGIHFVGCSTRAACGARVICKRDLSSLSWRVRKHCKTSADRRTKLLKRSPIASRCVCTTNAPTQPIGHCAFAARLALLFRIHRRRLRRVLVNGCPHTQWTTRPANRHCAPYV